MPAHETSAVDSATSRCPRDRSPVAAIEFDPYDSDLTEPIVWNKYDELRSAGPAAHSPARGGFYLLGRFAEVRAALRDPESFSSASGHRIPTDGSQKSIPIDFDPPTHTDYRQIMTHAVSPDRVRQMRPFVHDLITDLVGEFRKTGGGDFVRAVALPLPLQVLTELVGFSVGTVSRFRELTEAMWSRITHVDYSEARGQIYLLMQAELEHHRREPKDDFVTWLLDATANDREITDDERIRILSTFAVAGHETTMNASSTLVWLLVSRPGLQDRLRADPALAPRYVEEMLRYRTPAQNFARRTTCPVDIKGMQIPEGEAVLLSYAAANRDPERFPNPDQFDPDRESRGHLAFGWGIHQCMGAALARSELTILLETLCEHPPLRLTDDVRWSSLQGGNHFGPTQLPLTFDE
ncbi:cytochrome P450 [Rhodococcus sp. A14]|uniref:cytochrome P450 n=1 Tax=Rhodococcus sp. A14 TaxID=1194106 RepID=UPI00141F63B0|nr:cytochrome P450 [Rhodococcus sp. A14]